MYALFFLAISSFVLSLVLTPLCRNAFRRLGIVDHPDGHRKLHLDPIPRVGGVPIALSYLAAFALLLLSPFNAGDLISRHLQQALLLVPAASLVFATGLLDDLIGLKPWQKLAGQAAASLLAYWAGVRVLTVVGHGSDNWWWTLPLTILWLVACTNAFNLIDGVDGLASGLGLFATLTTFVAALLQKNVPLALATIPLAGALLGFLRYNFNPASIFLGDSGSLLIGFLLGCFGVIWSQKSATFLGMTAPLMTLAIPLLDVCLSVVRRFLRHQPVFGGDRGHIHHRLLDRGFTPRRVALLLYGVCALGASFSLLQGFLHNRGQGLIILLFCGVTWLGVQHLGYVEFGVARRLLVGGAFRRMLNGQLVLRNFEKSLTAAKTVGDFWLALRETCKSLGFNEVRLQLGDEVYRDYVGDSLPQDCWQLRVPLADLGYLNLTREFHSQTLPGIIAPLVDIIQSQFQVKCEQFEFAASTVSTHAIPQRLSVSQAAGRAN
jgi:UDP-GlcNAc:undecaprenyl-phosphate/decaprenyl-phosphate GlcNAc-1-phosphate transferase